MRQELAYVRSKDPIEGWPDYVLCYDIDDLNKGYIENNHLLLEFEFNRDTLGFTEALKNCRTFDVSCKDYQIFSIKVWNCKQKTIESHEPNPICKIIFNIAPDKVCLFEEDVV